MPNDVPDWTAQTKANLVGGISNLNLGDVGAPSLQADSVTETLGGTGGFGGQAMAVLASFKAAAASTIAKVGALGAIAVGTATSVSPTFGQAPTAGNLLVAWVTAGSADPTTAAAGWVKAKSDNFNGQFAAVWYKPNAAGGDAAPTFTVGAGSNFMSAQLGEFSGVATAAPVDQVGSTPISANPGTVVGAAADVAFGDLVLTASRWILGGNGTASFTDTINNGGTVVQAGAANVGVGGDRAVNGTYAIIPAATVAQPLGVAEWAYDATGTNAPAQGTAASVVLAATPGKTYIAASIDGDVAQISGAASVPDLQLLDGAAVKWQKQGIVGAAVGSFWTVSKGPCAFPGTKGNSMTLAFNGNGAGIAQSVAIGAYLR